MSSPEKFKMSDGDWICSDSQCSNVNFARRNSCNRCGKEKMSIPHKKKLGHEIGKAAAEKSRGLFSADDWQCGRCGNVNWARRQTCNMCNAPKFGEVEERTGLGGGYNERENVEYVEREESDGEYDEFGRKKKKYRGHEERSSKPKKSSQKEEKVVEQSKYTAKDEEEEEEDEDEEGDLSKYDLSGWGDDDDDNEKDDTNHKKSVASSSSSSRSSSASSQSSSRGSKSKRRASRSRSPSPDPKRQKKGSSSSSRSRSTSPRERSLSSSPVPLKK